jgi:cell division protease FtsH
LAASAGDRRRQKQLASGQMRDLGDAMHFDDDRAGVLRCGRPAASARRSTRSLPVKSSLFPCTCRAGLALSLLLATACAGGAESRPTDEFALKRFAEPSKDERRQPSAWARPFVAERTDVTFDDVVGAEHAKQTLSALMALWRQIPATAGLAAHPPKGALITGPDGVGKTMLAKAAARSAGLPLLQVSGAELLADGALSAGERLHGLFVQARRQAPAIVLLPQVDALGSVHPLGGGRPDVLAQLLAELDQLSAQDRVFAIATAVDVRSLPKELTSPGHFEHVIGVSPPDARQRQQLLERLTQDIPQAADVQLAAIGEQLAHQTPATLVHLVQAAAAAALLEGRREVRMGDWEQAIDAFWLGPVDHSTATSDASRWRTACHEAGHAVVASLVPNGRRVRKVSIVPRAYARGVTSFTPSEPAEALTEADVFALMATAVGGIEGEAALTENGASEGSSSDLMLAQMLARQAVTSWGFDVATSRQTPFEFSMNGGELGVGNALRDRIDDAVEQMTKEAVDYAARAFDELPTRRAAYEVAEALFARGELSGAEVRDIVRRHSERPLWLDQPPETADAMRQWTRQTLDDRLREQQDVESAALTSPASPSSTPPAPDR